MNTITQEKKTTESEVKNDTKCCVAASEVKPKYSVAEMKDAYEVSVEVPGAKRESVEIGFDGGILDITASRTDSVPETWRPLGAGLSRSGYRLKFSVAESIAAEKIAASVENGVLKVTLPLKDAVKPRSITVD